MAGICWPRGGVAAAAAWAWAWATAFAGAAWAQSGDLVGTVGLLGPLERENIAVEVQGLARTGPLLGDRLGLQAAGAVTTDRALVAHAGVFVEFRPRNDWSIIASTGPSLFDDGRGRDLGSDFAFQSQLEVTRRLYDERLWVGLFLNHRSNAGFADDNPGDETVGVVIQIRDIWRTPFDPEPPSAPREERRGVRGLIHDVLRPGALP